MGTLSRPRAVVLALALAGCARVPKDRYGIDAVRFEGVKQFDEDALAACLYSRERSAVRLGLGGVERHRCGVAPFEKRGKRVDLWSWGWTDWSIYDRLAFERDSARILRWYEARGHHQARVVAATAEPVQAKGDDTLDPKAAEPGCERISKRQGCEVQLKFVVDEGEPTLVQTLLLEGVSGLPPKLAESTRDALQLRRGDRFDEALYEGSKQAVIELLQEDGYAHARVEGAVRIDRERHSADVRLLASPGPRCRFGQVQIEGAADSLAAMARAMTMIDPGDAFSPAAIRGARRAVFASGAFGSVSVEPLLTSGSDTVDVLVRVVPVRKHVYGVGLGMQAGIVTRGDTWDPVSVPQWDVHLVAKYRQNRFLGGPRRLSLENRPALIIQEPFPQFTTPRFGNELRTELRHVGLGDPRTVVALGADYIWGPDPFDTFFRHRVDTGLTFERRFLRDDHLYLSTGLKNSVYRVPEGELTSDGAEPSANYLLTYFFQRIRFDYRDDEQRPRLGFMYQTEIQEAGMGKASSWAYLRTTPDLRVYLPLPWQITLTTRFALGMYFILRADQKLDDLSRDLGPRDLRLRGGGATSNRGFLPGELGDGSDGGTRRWEASCELRVPLTNVFGVVGFFDAGDVSKKSEFRWNYPQASAGFGLRYFTVIGAIRVDLAWRIENMQVFGPDQRDPGGELSEVDFGFATMDGAIHFTLGESF
jgi:outer membrane protein assembly factor BamA